MPLQVIGVDRPELREYFDVLVVSVKGRQSQASMLSGGGERLFLVVLLGDEAFLLRLRRRSALGVLHNIITLMF